MSGKLFFAIIILIISLKALFCDDFCHKTISVNGIESDSYFGYRVQLRSPNRVLVTAPRATSTYSSQAKVNRTGAVFQCDLQTGECAQYRLLAPGSDGTEQRVEQGYIYIKPDREYGWLGAAMDGPNRIDDPLVVCAPRWKNMYYSNRIESIYLVNGMCYFLNDASQVENEAVALIPLKDTNRTYYEAAEGSYWRYGLGQAGLSVQWRRQRPAQLLVGAPGLLNWRGGLARYDKVPGAGGEHGQVPILLDFEEYSYFGYAMAQGRFQKGSGAVWYVSGAPRGSAVRGQVFVYELTPDGKQQPLVKYVSVGKMIGEYYGAALAVADVDGKDGDDILVGAPLHSGDCTAHGHCYQDVGCIYLLLNLGGGIFKRSQFLVKNSKQLEMRGARFGTALAAVGDLDGDGLTDVAVGAPYFNDGAGALFIYYGDDTDGLKTVYKLLLAESFENGLRGFGISVSGGVDVDGNSVPDLAVGAHNSGQVVVLFSRPPITVRTHLNSSQAHFDSNTSAITLQACVRFQGKYLPKHLDFRLTLDFIDARFQFKENTQSCSRNLTIEKKKVKCEEFIIYAKEQKTLRDYSDLDVSMRYDVTEEDCQKRPLLKENKTGSVLNLKYNSGCEGDCIPDLIVSAEFREKDHQGVWSTTESLLVGSSRSLELIATVGNRGDPAHNSELQLSLPPCLSISQAGLTEVDQQRYSLGTVAGRTNKTVSFKLQVKVELVNFSVPLLIVSLNVSSGGKEAKPADNAASVSLALQRDNLLEVKAGMSYPAELTLHGDQTSIQLVHSYVLENSGVSPIDTWSMDIRLPANLSFGTQNASLLHVRRPEVKVWQRSESGAVDDTESCLIVNDFKFEGDQRRVRRAAPEPLQLQDRSVSCSEGSHLEVRCMDIMCSYQHTLYPGGYASLNITLALDVPLLLQAERARWPLKLMSEVEARAGTGVQHTSNASTLLHRQPESGANLAVWLPCLAGALLLLLALALLLYKCGFLRRNRLRGGGGELLMTAELNSPSRHDHYQEQEKEH